MKCTDKLKNINSEDIAFYLFSTGIIFTVLGPSVHYSMWGLTLLTLIYSKVRNGIRFFPSVHCDSKKAFVLLMMFAFWASLPNFFTAETTYIWVHGLSYYVEFILGVLLTMRILNTEEKLDKFIKWFVIFNSVLAVLYTLHISSYFLGIPKSFTMPNGTMINNNTSGSYAFMIMPFIIWYSFSKIKNHLLRILMCFASLLIILISTSTGAWLSAFIETLILIFFMIKKGKTSLKELATYILITFTALALFNFTYECKPYRMIKDELSNSSSLISGETDLNRVTNHRYDIWRSTIYMSKKHPLLGYGRKSYYTEFKNNMDTFKKEFQDYKTDYPMNHSHNMYLEILFAGGIPALFLFCSAYILLIFMSLKKLLHGNKIQEFISGIILPVFAGMAVYGTNGDIFEARRDIAVIFYLIIGFALILPSLETKNFKKSDVKE